MKICYKCKTEKENIFFSKDRSRKDGLSYICRSCRKVNDKKLNSTELRKLKIKNYDLKKNYNITFNDKIKMMQDQNNKCYICKKDLLNLKEKQIHLDHDHKTKKIRKILCNYCNSVLGMVKEDTNILTNLIKYINEHK